MLRRILTIAFAAALSACVSHHAKLAHVAPPIVTAPAPPPALAQGLWAVLDPGCPRPVGANIHQWPACASPFWIGRDGKAVIIHSAAWGATGHIDASFAADYSLAGGDPVIAQVGTQKDGYLYLALTQLSTDQQGQLVDAMGAAISCPKAAQSGLLIKPSLNGCDDATPEAVRRAAVLALQDHAALDEVAFIAPGNP